MEARFHPAILVDTEEIQAYLFLARPGWDDFFSQEFDRLVDNILESPKMYVRIGKNRRRDYRRAAFDRFPYVLIYAIHESSIDFLSVHHGAQHPETWLDRGENF